MEEIKIKWDQKSGALLHMGIGPLYQETPGSLPSVPDRAQKGHMSTWREGAPRGPERKPQNEIYLDLGPLSLQNCEK